MFSDLAPISNNGYRQQLYTDPGILQGQEFLRNENKIKKIVERNLDLNMVSDMNGSESTIINSVENFEPSEDDFKEGLVSQNKAEQIKQNQLKEKQLKQNQLKEFSSVARSFATCEMGQVFSDSEGKCIERFQSSKSNIQEGFREGLSTDEKYNNLKNQYNTVLSAYNRLITEFQSVNTGGLTTSSDSSRASQERATYFNKLKELSVQLNNISTQLLGSVKEDTATDFASYNKMQQAIDEVQLRIKEIYKKIQENKTKNPADIETSLAKESETALLTKQRYYMYVIWFIIMVVVLYVTITNLVNAESSFTVLLICLIVLVCLFIFFIYNKWNSEWYDFKYKLKNFNFGIPEIPKIDFNPLVRIRYTT